MTPYYQDDLVTIYHGDCREVLPAIVGCGADDSLHQLCMFCEDREREDVEDFEAETFGDPNE